jgi:ribosomal protein S18 acetylase RimI-like enzyme
MSNFLDKLSVRRMIKEDLDYIVEIDTKVLGESRKDYWATKIIKQAETRPPDASLVSEIDGKVAGFILGEVSGW